MKVEEWIDEWTALWPAEVKSGGESIQTKAKYTVNKMVKWCKKHPQYDKDTIFAATKLYISERRAENYFGIRRAIYFIDKLGVGSALEDFCEKIMENLSNKMIKGANNIMPPPEYNPINDFI